MSILLVLLPFIFFALIITAVVLITLNARKRERERSQQLQASANVLGWQFSENAPLNWLPNLNNFAIFNQGHTKNIRNIMYGEANGVKAALFDYIYVTGYGKNRRTHYQSVVYFEPRNLNIPFFSLRPENAFHKIFTVFGYQDIDFGNRPTFSSKYLLRGADEQAIRQAFHDALLGFYEMNQGISTDGGGNQLFIFREGYRTPAHEAQSFINWGLQFQTLFPTNREVGWTA